ncbi:MAG: ABC transporter permease, partial [Selenomonadaceae bacterium]|nr:ABC transporter permease [Selenomonadaceae bacterium]
LYTSKLVIENNSFGSVVIPKNYSKEINGTGSTSIELIIDNTNRSVGGTVAKAVQSVLSNQNTNFNLSLRTLYNPTGGYIDFFLAALIMHSTQIAIVFALLQIFFRRAKK